MKVSDYVADFVASLNTRVYGVSGGMAMYLNDSLVHHPDIKFVATHHEQAAAFAAEADARITNRMAIVHCTAGPGVTNTMTGVASAWADSIPMMVIAGQVERRTLKRNSGVRQLGISEVDGPALMQSITKYAITLTEPKMIRYVLEEAHHLAMDGRKGPVFIEIPIDVQSSEVDPAKLITFKKEPMATVSYAHPIMGEEVERCIALIRDADRPVCIIGNGIHLAGAEKEFNEFLRTNIPILCSWSGADLIHSEHPLYIGRPGLIGDRAGNFAIQNADFILAIGTRLSIPQIGHANDLFALKADNIVVVDIDINEIKKKTLRSSVRIIHGDAKDFLTEFNRSTANSAVVHPDVALWRVKCREWKYAYPVILPEYDKEEEDGLNAYYFLGELAKNIQEDAIIVTDVGTSFVCTMQAMPMTGRQRMFHNPGIASMGFGIPAAIGACMASGGRQVICLTGDGGSMFNLQELQTIVTHKLPVTIFLYENNGYKTMQVTQGNHFGRESVSSPQSNMGWPDFNKLADAFGMESVEIHNNGHLRDFFETRRAGPVLCKVRLSKNNQVMPLVKSKIENGEFIPVGIEDMWPYLPREEFEENMKQRSSDDVERFDEFGACVG